MINECFAWKGKHVGVRCINAGDFIRSIDRSDS